MNPVSRSPLQRKQPTTFNPELMQKIMDLIAQGNSLADVCAKDRALPVPKTIYRWLREHPEFRDQWNFAKECKSHTLMDEVLMLARSLKGHLGDHEVSFKKSRAISVAIEALRDIASKLNPREYGRQQQPNTIIPIQIVTNMNLGQEGPAARDQGDSIYQIEVPYKIIAENE